MLTDLVAGFIDLIYPACCILCKNHLTPVEKPHQLCFACQKTIAKNRPPFCRRCSRPPENPAHFFCLSCQETPLAFDQSWGAFLYTGTMQRLIHLFKYGHKTGLRHFFTDQILSFVESYHIDVSQADCLVPIPLHPARLRERGYNQSRLIAELIAQELRVPVISHNLIRTRHTPNQARLTQKERWTNIQAAFKIKNPKEFRGKKILIIDDLYTTGATISEAARLLKAAGADEVKALVLAVAVPKQSKRKNADPAQLYLE